MNDNLFYIENKNTDGFFSRKQFCFVDNYESAFGSSYYRCIGIFRGLRYIYHDEIILNLQIVEISPEGKRGSITIPQITRNTSCLRFKLLKSKNLYPKKLI